MSERETTVIARTVTRVVTPIILLVAVALLLQGHNRPGGGFIAGVLTTTAFALVYIIHGRAFLQQDLLGVSPTGFGLLSGIVETYAQTFAVGLALALAGGVAAMAFGLPFLTQAVAFVEHVPLYGEMEVASALAFDVGVYLVVVGALLTILAVVGGE